MSVTFTRRADVTDPYDRIAWADLSGELRDFTGWVLSMEIIHPTTNEIRTIKTSGVVGGDGTGLSNVVITWTPEEMAPLAGLTRWKGRIVADKDEDRTEFVLDGEGTLPVWSFEPVPTEPTPP